SFICFSYSAPTFVILRKYPEQIIYDQNGRPFMLRVEDPEATSMVTESRYKYYYYLFNAQNDVIGLIDRDGNKVVSYVYNSWGAPLTTADSSGMDIAGLNPFRYRCYCYDEETAFYYLKSRYYDPWVGRFINSDGYVSTGMGMNCCNMFIYCENNPVNRLDLEGHFWEEVWNGFVQFIEPVGGALAAAAGISQLDGPLPGPADLVGLAIAGGALLFCAGAAAVAGVKNAAGSAKKVSNNKEEKNYTVYVLKDSVGTVQYVGRTKDADAREKAHGMNPARENLEFVAKVSNLNYYEARGLEQTYMLYYHTINTANKMNNQINGISLKNPQLQRYLTAAEGALGYMWNQVSNEVLNWAGL
ncbi:MAG: RHS repeat-associated core domain-containing protein, partial [Schaedlerella sp.]|nr:RHS repeat-associated core domain-containing protein [Schaedlerella sp.]